MRPVSWCAATRQYEQRAQEEERRGYLEQLGEAVWQLYAQGRVSEPELVSLCHQIQTTTHEITELQKQAATLRKEQAAGPMKCLDCGHEVDARDAFCAFCGAKVTQADALPAAHSTCTQCGRTIRPGARFCGHCGQPQVTR
ncbi:MAG: zinc ribbon domain-containing protein [Anaerolineales bacterium]|nr:zinc ribbon domain-containing protein [Anaerolineales bacterium]